MPWRWWFPNLQNYNYGKIFFSDILKDTYFVFEIWMTESEKGVLLSINILLIDPFEN